MTFPLRLEHPCVLTETEEEDLIQPGGWSGIQPKHRLPAGFLDHLRPENSRWPWTTGNREVTVKGASFREAQIGFIRRHAHEGTSVE
ncbi:hypothetical protein GCM10009099_30160 [Caenispirillum bisanense]